MKMKGNLKGNQTKLDANKDGKIGKEDFAMLRNKKGDKKKVGKIYKKNKGKIKKKRKNARRKKVGN